MELISKEELINKINAYMVTTPDVNMVRKLINETPTIESRQKGTWRRISPAKIYECSCCGQNLLTQNIDCYNYCHGCGAEMEGEE